MQTEVAHKDSGHIWTAARSSWLSEDGWRGGLGSRYEIVTVDPAAAMRYVSAGCQSVAVEDHQRLAVWSGKQVGAKVLGRACDGL
jgi:hypothetical protein